MVYDYYNVEVPGDCFDSLSRLTELAIDIARERARLYCVPAVWTAKHIRGTVGDFRVQFRVCRMRRKVIRKAA